MNGVLPHLSTTLGQRATTHKFQRTLLRRLPALEKHQKAKVVNSFMPTNGIVYPLARRVGALPMVSTVLKQYSF